MKSSKRIVSLCFCFMLQMAGGDVWAAAQDQAKKPSYNLGEFNAYNAALNEKDSQSRIKLLDELLQKYPSTELQDLLPFIYPAYYTDYLTLGNYPQALAYIDKMLALGDKITAFDRLKALGTRAMPYAQTVNDKALQTPDAYTKARDAAAKGLETLDQWQKPADVSDDNFRKAKAAFGVLFHSAAGVSDTNLKNYKGAETSFRAALAIDPDNALTHYRLANAYLADTPQQTVDGFWGISRAIALKVPGTDAVKAYLRNQILNYQQLSCDKLVDSEVDELITLASSSSERPGSLTIPSADDLQKVRNDTASFVPWLREGGEHGKVMWLATCGAEYQDVPVKVIDVTPGEGGRHGGGQR